MGILYITHIASGLGWHSAIKQWYSWPQPLAITSRLSNGYETVRHCHYRGSGRVKLSCYILPKVLDCENVAAGFWSVRSSPSSPRQLLYRAPASYPTHQAPPREGVLWPKHWRGYWDFGWVHGLLLYLTTGRASSWTPGCLVSKPALCSLRHMPSWESQFRVVLISGDLLSYARAISLRQGDYGLFYFNSDKEMRVNVL